ncbi:short-chain dehydrogenase [Pseudomonas sp. Cab53]|uniref:Short-chain dehydrogenase n=2 Tax=Pseudomonas TaxID=286 RepID=A0A423GE46_9PSED|nr:MULTISPECIES: SDR family oxidoreductase [Pseudomonas]KIQ57827.1 short-chain dehydrogenase [Pseudomonas fluorescens]ROM85138.1 short-chain dehydrogenase [Pseudomonas brassicacearum]BBP64600.1 short-chain dehydrogenase [Pseudomonas sp. Cab53]
MDLELQGRVAIVTGGGMGIGKEVARFLSQEGCKVAICARRMEFLQQAAEEISAETGNEVLPLYCDTNQMSAVTDMVQAAYKHFGRIDILVNGAAAPSGVVRNDIEHAGDDELLSDLNTKVIGYFRCAKAVTPHMKAGGFGRIINIGGLTGRGSKVLSGMRNLAIAHMTKTLSDQLGPAGITVNLIHPGVVDTPHIQELYEREGIKQGKTPGQVEQGYIDATPIRRTLAPIEMGWLIGFLASPKAGAVTGESIGIDGGLTRGIFI